MKLWLILNEPKLTDYKSHSEPYHAFVVLFVDGNHAAFDDKMRYLIKVWKECPSFLSLIIWCFFTQFLMVSLWFMSLLKKETYCQEIIQPSPKPKC